MHVAENLWFQSSIFKLIKNVFEEPQVIEFFKHFTLIRLYTDGGDYASEYQQMEIDRYGTSALPFYVVIDQYENKINTFHGMDPDVNKFINFLEESLNQFNKGI